MNELMDLIVKSIKLTGDVECLHKPGAVRLDDYPHLVYAPEQHGRGIRLEDTGVAVADIAAAFAVTPSCEAVASQFNTTADHVAEAIRYAVAAGAAITEG